MKINKFIALIGILIVCFSLVINGSSTYANDKEEVQDQMVINEANKIVLSKKEESQQVDSEKKLVKTLQDSDEKQFDDVIKEYIDNDSVVADKIQENEKVNSIEDIKVVNQNGEEVSSTYNIDDKNQILITSEGLYLDSLEESEPTMATPEEEEALESDSLGEDNLFSKITTKINGLVFGEKVSAAASKTKSASHSRTKYSWYGTKLFTAKIAAKFTYNGSKVTAYRTENYIKRHFDGGIWSVYDKHSAIQKPSTKKRVAYQDGTASWGLSIKGVGLVFDETYIRVNVECNQNGKISKSSVLR